jgi:hypothetical protein
MRALIATALCLAAASALAAMHDPYQKYEAGCRLLASDREVEDWRGLKDQYRCLDHIDAVYYFKGHMEFCMPREVNSMQMARVLVAYMDRHPGQLQEPFVDLAIAAFKETWPCRR